MGAPGAGKSLALRRCLFLYSQQRQDKIPVYIPLSHYSLFLKAHSLASPFNTAEEDLDEQNSMPVVSPQQGTLLDFLYESDLPGMRHLRLYLKKLLEQGRLLLLCDGLNEVDPHFRTVIASELAELLLVTQNRLVVTSREMDYREQQELIMLGNEGHIQRAVIYPLQVEQVRQFIERFIQDQGRQGQHTAGQVMQMIDHSRLRYLCANPLILSTLMETIDKVGIERGKQLDTRGGLLQEYVAQLIEREQARSKWRRGAPAANDVVQLLSRIACAARWSNEPYALQFSAPEENVRRGAHFVALAGELLAWLEKHQAHSPFGPDQRSDLRRPPPLGRHRPGGNDRDALRGGSAVGHAPQSRPQSRWCTQFSPYKLSRLFRWRIFCGKCHQRTISCAFSRATCQCWLLERTRGSLGRSAG